MPTLNWLTREQDLKAADNAESRLLAEEEQYSCGDPDTGNFIVQGDNLEALKALLPFYDPPYNTGSAFEHYDDNTELLREDGSIWISIDDTDGHYLLICYIIIIYIIIAHIDLGKYNLMDGAV
jgi:adenine-specific DNA-methyltransferase